MKFHDAVQEIKERLSIVDVIGEYVTLQRKGSNYVGLCPFHNEDTPSFVVNEAKKIYRCFGQCNKGGNIYTFLQDFLHISFREAVLMMAKKANIEIDDDISSNESYKKNEEKKKKMYELYRDVANTYYKILFSDKGKDGLEYLKSRNLTKETIKKFGLGFAPNDFGYVYKIMKDKGYDDTLLFESKLFRLYDEKPCDAFYNRVMFPLVDIYKHVIGFQSRTLETKPKERKYVNSDDSLIFHKKSFLYAMNFAFVSKENFYILCEGNMDAITIHQAGFDNAVATMGTAFNESQMYLLKRKPKKVYLCQDTDEAGVNAIINSDKILKKAGIETYVLDFSPSKDVDEFINKYGVEEFKNKLKSPIPTFLFYISTLKKKYNLNDPYEQEKYFNTIISELANIPNTFVRDNYLKSIAIQEKLDAGILHNLLGEYLKGNTIKNDLFHNNVIVKDNETEFSLSKVDSNFINLIYFLPEYKDKIKSIISDSELSNDIYRYLYNLYLEGKTISDVYDSISDRSEDDKNIINSIINDKYNYDSEDKSTLVNSLNQIIRQIKIRYIKSVNKDDLDKVFEINKSIMNINKTNYLL